MPHATVNGVRLYYEEHGSGTPLLMLHGFAGTTRMWDTQVAAFSRRCRFITYDMRGHGQSEVPEDLSEYSMDMAVEDQYQLLKHLGVQKSVIGGLSLGGSVALQFFEKHSEMCLGLILCDTGPGYRNPQRAAEWNKECIERAEVLEQGGIEAFLSNPYSDMDYYTPLNLMRKHNPKGLALVARGIMANISAVHVLEQINVPTLIVVGDRDEPFLFPSEYMQKRIRGSDLVVIKDAGHGCNIDQPETFNSAILRFLNLVGVGT